MANVSLNKEEGRGVETKIKEQGGIALPALKELDTAITSLEGMWEGESARKFLDAYAEIAPVLTVKLPELLAEMEKELNARLTAREEADAL